MPIAPFHVYLASIGKVDDEANKLYEDLQRAGIEVLYDDRNTRPGDKFADAELMGIPYRVVISDRSLKANQVELLNRSSGEVAMLPLSSVIAELKSRIPS
jgi:prolyl-tRNA synthetase